VLLVPQVTWLPGITIILGTVAACIGAMQGGRRQG
jgi:hypothetical protein